MSQTNDRDLGDRFATLRQEDAQATPSLTATLAAARLRDRPRLSLSPWTPAVAVAAVALVVMAVTVLVPNDRGGPLVDLTAARWQGPTDFLLQVPGEDYLRTVPTFTADWRNP